MRRPDQDRFDLFARPLEILDDQFTAFAENHGLQLEKNPNRQPGRILRRAGAVEQIIELSQDDHWLQVNDRADLTYSLAVAAFYEPPEDRLSLWKLGEMLLEHEPLEVISERLSERLQRAAQLMGLWTPTSIMLRGERLRNLKGEHDLGLLSPT